MNACMLQSRSPHPSTNGLSIASGACKPATRWYLHYIHRKCTVLVVSPGDSQQQQCCCCCWLSALFQTNTAPAAGLQVQTMQVIYPSAYLGRLMPCRWGVLQILAQLTTNTTEMARRMTAPDCQCTAGNVQGVGCTNHHVCGAGYFELSISLVAITAMIVFMLAW